MQHILRWGMRMASKSMARVQRPGSGRGPRVHHPDAPELGALGRARDSRVVCVEHELAGSWRARSEVACRLSREGVSVVVRLLCCTDYGMFMVC